MNPQTCVSGLLLLATACSCVVAQSTGQVRQPPSAEPTSRPATSQPSATATSGNAEVDRLLDKLETAGRDKRGISCKLAHSLVVVMPVESRKKKTGELIFYRDARQTRFRIHFNKLEADGIISRDQEFFAFDGEYFIERNDKSKTLTRRRIVRKGDRNDPFALGKGPFPLPFGQKREDILQHFDVKLAKFEIGDPPGSKHLRCVPRAGTDLAEKYTRVDFYIDPNLSLPVRIVCERRADGDRIEVDFRDITTFRELVPAKFEVTKPSGFTESTEDLTDKPGRINLDP